MPNRTVVVTAYGAFTSLGFARESWQRICDGQIGIRRVDHWADKLPEVKVAALLDKQLPPLNDTTPDLTQWYRQEKIDKRSDRSVQIAFRALGDILRNFPGIFENIPDRKRFGVVCGPSLGGQGRNEEGHDIFVNGKFGEHIRKQVVRIIQVMPDAFCGFASQVLVATGYSSCCFTACATGLSNILHAAEKIESGRADIMLAGGFEANTDYLTATFEGPGALTHCDDPDFASRPFDIKRDGFVIGEGAGLVVLEDLESALARGIRPLAVLEGWSQRCGASHMTQGNSAIQAETIQEALEHARLKPQQIEVVSDHATSTPMGDEREAAAQSTIFGPHQILVMATKANLGHTLGGSGAIEFIQCIQAIQTARIPAITGLRDPDPACHPDCLVFPRKLTETPVTTAMTENFGFGDKNAVAIIRTYEP